MSDPGFVICGTGVSFWLGNGLLQYFGCCSTKVSILLHPFLHSEAFGLGAFYEETIRKLDARRADLLAKTPEAVEEPTEDTSGIIKMAIRFDRYISTIFQDQLCRSFRGCYVNNVKLSNYRFPCS